MLWVWGMLWKFIGTRTIHEFQWFVRLHMLDTKKTWSDNHKITLISTVVGKVSYTNDCRLVVICYKYRLRQKLIIQSWFANKINLPLLTYVRVHGESRYYNFMTRGSYLWQTIYSYLKKSSTSSIQQFGLYGVIKSLYSQQRTLMTSHYLWNNVIIILLFVVITEIMS